MGPKYIDGKIISKLVHYHLLSFLYIPIVFFIGNLFGDLQDVGDLNWCYSILLIIGELGKTYLLMKSLNRSIKFFQKKEVLYNLTLCVLSIGIFDLLEVCAGAPFVKNQARTLSLAVTLTILTTFSSCLKIGYDETIELILNITSYNCDVVSNIVMINTCFTLIGAWLGAIVIPLDWDRPWQVWPIPCYLGCLIGNTVGAIVNIIASAQFKFTKHTFVKP